MVGSSMASAMMKGSAAWRRGWYRAASCFSFGEPLAAHCSRMAGVTSTQRTPT